MGREREVRVTVLGDSRGGQKALLDLEDRASRTESRFDGLGSKLAGFGKVAAVGLGGAAVGIGAFLTKATLSASDLGETLSKVGVVFGEAKDQVVADADFMAKSFGIPKQQFLDAASAIGLIGKASGMAKDAVGPFSTNMARLATDAASFYNVPLDEALAAIQSGLIGEAEPMRKFGVLLSENAVKEEAYALGIAKRGAELDEGQKVQARASLIMKGMGDATGDLERTQGSLANRIREIKGRLENFAATIGTAVVPIVIRLMDAGVALGDRLGPVFSYLTEVAGFIGPAFQAAFSGEGVTSDGIVGVAERVGVALRAVVDWVKENWPQIQATVSEVLETVGAVITGFVDIVSTIWANFGEQIVSYTQNAFGALMEIVGGAMDIIQGIVATVTAIIHGDWSAAWDGIKQILAGAWEVIQGLVDQAMNMMQTAISIGMEILASIISSAFEGIVNFMASIPGRILDALGNLGDLLYSAGQDLIWGMLNGIASMAHRLADAAVSVARGAVNAVKNFLGIGSPSKLFMGFGVNIGEGLAIGMDQSQGKAGAAGLGLAAAAVPTSLGLRGAVGGGNGAWSSGGSAGVIIHVAGSVVTERQLVEAVQAGLLQKQRRVPTLGLT